MKIKKKNQLPQEKNPPILLTRRPVRILSCPRSPAVSLYFPLSQSTAIPFSWEHTPGVPKSIYSSSLSDHGGDDQDGYVGSSEYENNNDNRDGDGDHEEVTVGANGGQDRDGNKEKQEEKEEEICIPQAPPSANFRSSSVRLLCKVACSLAQRTFMQSQQQQKKNKNNKKKKKKKNELPNAPAKNPFLKALLEFSKGWNSLKASARLRMKTMAKSTKKRCLISWSRASCGKSCHVRGQVQVLVPHKCTPKVAP